MPTLIDDTGESIQINPDGLVRADGIIAFRKVQRDGIIYVQFCDSDRMRSVCRGSRYVEIPLDTLTKRLSDNEAGT